jgi:lysophospholipase L1-like esterase
VPRRAYVVAVMGDSLTDYASHGGGFIHVLERHCPKSRFDNYGKGGAMTNQMRRRFQAKVHAPSAPAYTHVIVFGGVNDLYSDITANRKNDKIEGDLAQMYDWARQGGSKVVAISVTPWGGFRKYYNARRGENTRLLNAWMRDQVGARVDYFVDAYALLACGESLCPEYFEPFHDGIHFGAEGHHKLGEALWSQVFSDCL